MRKGAFQIARESTYARTFGIKICYALYFKENKKSLLAYSESI